jgi:hypothetical protein
MQYLTIETALLRAKESSQAATSDEAYLTELLELSAAYTRLPPVDPAIDPPLPVEPLVKHYRPFFCAARLLAQNPDLRDLSEATGEAKFTLAQPRIDDLMGLQYAYDNANDLDVPPGFEGYILARGGGSAAPSGPTPGSVKLGALPGSSSVPTTIRF